MAVGELPIAFRVDKPVAQPGFPQPRQQGAVQLLTRTRALTGMQKEALVEGSADGTCWRLLCDEGPWLNGTDLAPFPLGYFATGLASCFVADILAEARAQHVPLGRLDLGVDLHFTMEGSVLRGTMAAGVDSIRITADCSVASADTALEALLAAALERRSVIAAALRGRLPGRFCVRVNGALVGWPGERVAELESVPDPLLAFDEVRPSPRKGALQPLIRKDETAPPAVGGPAVGLQSEQKRSVHVHSAARLVEAGLAEIGVHCVQPAGSRFVFLSDVGLRPKRPRRAPSGLIYLSAGIAFCFMTQLGRYAQIRKLPLRDYRIAQLTAFRLEGAEPVETAVFLDSDDTAANNLEMVRMGERTCYVHTSFREPVEVSWRTGG